MSHSQYLGVKIACNPEFVEILVAELASTGYDSMMETEPGLEAYIEKSRFNEEDIRQLVIRYPDARITFETEELQNRNWNEEWEKNYDSIDVDGVILVRAAFHNPRPDYRHQLIINPRMSFGTGHHATTYLMLRHQLEIPHTNKRVLDAGCGTAILAIMAEKLGATEVLAYDNNSWSTENAPENIALNGCKNVTIREGTIDTIGTTGQYDLILANINKNVLLQEMPDYAKRLPKGGCIILSGFYTEDTEDILKRARQCHLQWVKAGERNNWSSVIFHKT